MLFCVPQFSRESIFRFWEIPISPYFYRPLREKSDFPIFPIYRTPTREEFLANALAALWEQGTINRNLVRLVRWFYGDLGDSIIPGNI